MCGKSCLRLNVCAQIIDCRSSYVGRIYSYLDHWNRLSKNRGIATQFGTGPGIVVFAVGIWDALDVKTCNNSKIMEIFNVTEKNQQSNSNNTYNIEDYLLEPTLEAALEFAKWNPQIQVFWRTPMYREGTPESLYNVRLSNMRNIALNWFQQKKKQHQDTINFDVMDVGGAIYSRSFGSERIEGDSPQHYGIQARMVTIQMLANKVHDRSSSVVDTAT